LSLQGAHLYTSAALTSWWRTVRRSTVPAVFAVLGTALLYPSWTSAQDAGATEPLVEDATAAGGEATSDAVPTDPTDVTDEGVPTEAVEASEGVAEVEKAMEQVAEETEEGLPAEFVIKFGDVHDWIRLTSGEWLKGKLKRLRDDDIEFDSDKLDLLTFSWDKVEQLHSPRINTYVFDNKLDVVGRAVVTKDKVLIETAEGVERYPRSELLSIIRGEHRERNFWSTRLSVGFSGSAGNTNQGQLNAHWDLRRADARTRTQLSYDGTFGYANKEPIVNRHLGIAEVKLFISKRFFFVPATSEFLNDTFTNFKFRATPGTGAGVHVFHTKKVEWDLGSAVGYQYTRFLSTAAGVANPQNDGFISFRTYADFDFTDDVELVLEWRSNVLYTNINLTNHMGSAKFSVEITDILDLQTTFKFYRTENPPPRADGTVPEKNDYEVIVSLALEIG
jgi:putative salt-induced outer membrane protein YdiY